MRDFILRISKCFSLQRRVPSFFILIVWPPKPVLRSRNQSALKGFTRQFALFKHTNASVVIMAFILIKRAETVTRSCPHMKW